MEIGNFKNKDKIMDISQLIIDNLAPMGRMISSMKKEPKGHICIWNGNIIVEEKGSMGIKKYRKVWFGDIDLTKDSKKLQKCAKEIGKPLYILRERDGRFDNETNPKIENAVAIINPNEKLNNIIS